MSLTDRYSVPTPPMPSVTISRPSTGTSLTIAGSGAAIAAGIVAARRRQRAREAAEARARRNAFLVLAGLLLVVLLASSERRRRRRRADAPAADLVTPDSLDNSLGERVQSARSATGTEAPSGNDGGATVGA